ncbi:succinylglutamate desuccinylase [Pseudocolwellia agarivorans]|uniref:succinylglutamate desuccinylase n=1 Tax=Pseudocolwellia agarivorans TaxID=1911682 RepID=UPI0009841861|nr:succinylglutamate desuccinylase [Pseudocolwellia agarivorans]
MSTLSEHQKELQTSGDFLKLSCENEWSLAEPFSFIVNSNNTSANISTKVTVLDTGIISFEPDCNTTQDIVLSSAIHGNETAPIEICNTLIKQLILGEIAATQRVLFLFGNPASINIGKRFVEENMNRLFSGAHSKPAADGSLVINKERTRAKLLENTIRRFYQQGDQVASNRSRCHYDLHTAIRGSKNDKFAVYPFQHEKPWKKEQLLFLKQCGITTVLLSHSPTTTFSYFSANEFGADAFTVELGKVKPFGENDMNNFTEVTNTLLALITGADIELGDYNPDDFDVFEIYQTINREAENFRLNFADDVDNFTSFPLNYVLAFDGDKEVKVKQDGEAIIFPNADVAIGQRALLTVTPTIIL